MPVPTILLTNDDGIDAAGLRTLESAIPPEWEIHVVAPAGAMSQCSHRITTHEPLRVGSRGPRRHLVAGTPADCVRLAWAHLLPRRPDWVLSGINHGGNLGADIPVSGTVAAVREAAYLGARGIALSHYRKNGLAFDWKWAASCVRTVIAELIDSPLDPGEFWNVNLPHLEEPQGVPDRELCPPSCRPLPVSFRPLFSQSDDRENESGQGNDELSDFIYDGVYADRAREPGSDVDVCFGGRISISKLSVQHQH